jgi:hypothetical protein
MRLTLIPLVLSMALCGAADVSAQGLGYAIAGPAGVSGFFGSIGSSFHAAAGGELLARGIAGAGAEIGVFGNASSLLIAFSANGVVHLVPSVRDRRVSPFVGAGYTRMGSGEGSFNALNVGGGADFWVKPHAGLRVEVRNHTRSDSRGSVQYWTVRGGVVLR